MQTDTLSLNADRHSLSLKADTPSFFLMQTDPLCLNADTLALSLNADRPTLS